MDAGASSHKQGLGLGYNLKTPNDNPICIGQLVQVLGGSQIGQTGKLISVSQENLICTVQLCVDGKRIYLPKALLGKTFLVIVKKVLLTFCNSKKEQTLRD